MNYILGLDIGIASVGWAVIDIDKDLNPYKINNLGVRIFDKAENPKDGSALALPRREARGARRRIRRRRHRLERIKNLLINNTIITKEGLEKLYNGSYLTDIYKIRYEALDRKLTNEEFARLLIHLAKRRGFKSNRKSTIEDKEQGKLLDAVNENTLLMKQKGYRTAGEMFYIDEKFSNHKRNTTNDYLCTLSRATLVEEVKTIFESQRIFGNVNANKQIEEDYLKIYTSQRSFDEGPGGTSIYGGNIIEKMFGRCTFEPEEKRAPKNSFSFEYFVLLNTINNLRIGHKGGKARELTKDEKKILIENALKKEKLTYANVRKLLNIDSEDYFKGLLWGKKGIEETESKTIFCKMDGYNKLRKALDNIEKGYIAKIPKEQLDQIAYALTAYKTDSKINKYLTEKSVPEEVINAIEGISFSKVGNLSLKAVRKIIPFLEQGYTYDKACEQAGYEFNKIAKIRSKKDFIEQITNPVVRRAVSQSIKVIHAVINQYGHPYRIHIELAREIGKGYKERQEIQKSQENNRQNNEAIKKEILETYGHEANGNDIVKYKLWKEQGGRCIYSDIYIDPSRLFKDGTYTDIDHIIPYSKCFDDSYQNKVLVMSGQNRQKSNQTPYEYLGQDNEKWREFEARVRTYIRSYGKQQRLLKKHITEEDEQEFKERNLNDTRYATRLIAQYLNQFIFSKEGRQTGRKEVVTVNGGITAYVRKRWGLSKIREEGDLHHALDAVVIACITDSMIKRITEYHKIRENKFNRSYLNNQLVEKETGEVLTREKYDEKYGITFPVPWEKFRDEVEARLSEDPNIIIKNCGISTYEGEHVKPIFVSRMPRRKNTGQGHQETLRGGKLEDKGYTIVRRPITELKLDKDGEIEGYYNKEANLELYYALRDQLKAHKGDAKEAFKNGFYKPQRQDAIPIPVKKVKIKEKATLTVPINKNTVASNGSMIRIDLFERDGKYYIVPIYAKDVVAKILPNKAIVAGKSYSEWIEMDENYTFLFTLYPNDIIYVKHKKGFNLTPQDKKEDSVCVVKEGFLYYTKTNIALGSIDARTHDSKYSVINLGVKTLEKIEKWQVDVLGNINCVHKEKRVSYYKK